MLKYFVKYRNIKILLLLLFLFIFLYFLTTIDFGNGTGVLKKEELSVTYRFPNTIRKIDDNYLVDFGKAAFGKLEIHTKFMKMFTELVY